MLSNKTVIINIKRKDRNTRVMRHENQGRNSKKPYFIGVCKMEKENQDKNVLKTSKVVNGLSTVWCGYQHKIFFVAKKNNKRPTNAPIDYGSSFFKCIPVMELTDMNNGK